MSEFKIKISTDLDTSEAEAKLKALANDNNIKLEVDMSNLNKQLDKIKKTFKDAFRIDSKFANDLKTIASKIQQLNKGLDDSVGGSGSTKKVNALIQQYKELYNLREKLQKQINSGKLTDDSIERTTNQIKEFNKQMSALKNQMTDSQRASVELFDAKKSTKALVDMNNYLNKIDAQADKIKKSIGDIDLGNISGQSKSELEDILQTVEKIQAEAKEGINLDLNVGNSLHQLTDMQQAVTRIKKESRDISASGLGGFWKDYKSSIAAYTIGDVLGDFTIDAIRGAVGTIMDLDAAFTNLRKVSDTPIEGTYYESIKDQAISTAKEVGMSSADVIQSVATAMQAGMGGMEESMAVAKQAMILANVGDMGAEEASSAISAVINSFQLDPLKEFQILTQGTAKTTTELTNAMDMLNHASNNYAIDSAGLSSSLANVGSVLNSYGIGLSDSIGLITAANEAMQDPDKVGTGLKSIAVNMAGLQTSAKDGSITLNKTAKALEGIAGIDIYSDKKTGQIKDMVVILDELQGKWKTFSEEEQLALSNAIAGKQNAAVFQSLMGNYETFKQIQSEFSEGIHFESASKENEQYVDSIAGKLNKLKEIWTSIATTFATSDFVKGALDGLNAISSVIEKIVSSDFGAWGIGLSALGLSITGIVKGFKGLKNVIDTISDVKNILKFGDMATDVAKTTTASSKLSKSLGTVIKSIGTSIKSWGLFSSAGATATTLVSAGLLALPAAIIAYDKYQNKVAERQIENSRETISSLKEQIKANETAVKSVRGIAEEYDLLSMKSNKTAKEQERYLELTNQIAKAFPDLVSGYDSAGNPILELNGSLETYIRNLDRAIEKQNELLNSEQNSLADQLEEAKKKLNTKEWNTRLENSSLDFIANPYDKEGGKGFDYKEYQKELETVVKNEKKWYDERLAYVEEYEKAKNDVREKYVNKLEGSSSYKTSSEADQKEMKDLLGMMDVYGMGAENASKFTKELSKLDKELVGTTAELGEHGKQIDKIEKSYANGNVNLAKYTDELTKQYEAAGKIDNESLNNWIGSLKDYISLTGDLDGANRQITKMSEALEELSGGKIDSSIWEQALAINVEPLEIAEQKLNSFLQAYGTGSQNLGKLGLADQLEEEFNGIDNLLTDITEEFEQNGEITPEFLVEATVEMGTPIQELVQEVVDDGEVSEEEIQLMLQVATEIRNEGEISEETKSKIKELFPDLTEEEIEARFTVKADIQAKKEIGDFLSTIKGTEDVEFALRCAVKGKEEAESLWKAIEGLPEEKQLQIIANYAEAQEAARSIGTSLDNLPAQTIIDIATNVDNAQLEDFLQAIDGLDGKQVSAFLQAEGASEALSQCETVQQMLDLINAFIATGKIQIEDNGSQEKVEATKQSLESTEGTYKADLMVATNKGDLDLVEGQIYEMDGKTYMAAFNVDTNEVELVETKETLDTIDGTEAIASVNVEADAKGAKDVEETISNIPEETNVTVKAQTELVDFQSKLNELQGQKVTVQLLIDSSNAMLKINNVKAGLSSFANETIQILADSSNAMLKINNVKSGLTSIPDETVKILADSSNAMLKINNVKAGLKSIPKTTTVNITANNSKALSAISAVRNALASISSKSVSLNVTKRVSTVQSSSTVSASATPTMLSNTSLANIPVTASAPATSDPSSLANVPVTAKASSNVLDISKILPSLDFDISHIKNLEEALERIGNQLDFLNEKSEATFGKQKIELLKQQIPLLRQQQEIQAQIAVNERNQNKQLKDWLSNKGFTFDGLGNISNYNDKLLSMEKNVESLKKKYDSLNDVSGDNKNEAAIKNAQKAYESANETLEKTKDYLEEYFTTNNTEITEASKKWWEYENAIKETEQAIRDVINAQLENKIDAVADQIDFLDSKIDNLNEQEKVTYLNQQNKLYKEQQNLAHQLAEQMRSQLATLDKNSDEYVELQHEIIQLSTEWWELESSIASTNETLEEIKRNKAIEPLRNSLEEINYLLDRHNDRLNLVDAQYENATGAEKIEYLTKKQQILNEQLSAQEEAYKRIYNLAKGTQGDLWKFGFKLDENSLISNYDEILNKLFGSDQYEIAKQYADEYMEVVRGDLIDIQTETYDTKNALSGIAEEMQEAIEEARQSSLEPFKNSLQEIEYELDRCKDKLELLDETNSRSQGKTKIDYLYDKIGLLNKQISTSQEEFNRLYSLAETMQGDLWQHGFELDENSLISNYDEVLNNLIGTEQYENAKAAADEYMELMRNDFIENNKSILEAQNAIKELTDEIELAERELKLFASENELTELNNEFDKLSSVLNVIESKLQYAFGTDKINLMNEQIGILNNQLELQTDKISAINDQMKVYQDSLGGYGFSFDEDGSIANYKEIMDSYRDTEVIEKLTELTKEYFDIHGELTNITEEYHNLSNEIKNVYKEQLEITQEIEGKITDEIKKEYEKRKEEIEKYTDERIELLEKEKNAYQDMRKEQQYEDSVDDKIAEITELQKKLDTAMKDNSISGMKRQAELQKEIAEAQKELGEITQDKIDTDFEKNIDDEIKRLEEEKENILENLDEEFTEENIAKMVSNALTNGFIELNGEIQSIQDLLINSINQSAEGYSVMANVIKEELVANLGIALETAKELDGIYSNLGLESYGSVNKAIENTTPTPSYGNSNKAVSFGDTIFNISGSTDNATLDKVEEMIKESQDKMLNKITRNLD